MGIVRLKRIRASRDTVVFNPGGEETHTSAGNTPPGFQPFVPATETRPELTTRALVLGCIFGLLFGAVTVYVGLRAGLTVGASIPISVLSISVLRAFGRRPYSKTTSCRPPAIRGSRLLPV